MGDFGILGGYTSPQAADVVLRVCNLNFVLKNKFHLQLEGHTAGRFRASISCGASDTVLIPDRLASTHCETGTQDPTCLLQPRKACN